ncbi:acyltransferase [Bosea sp. CCNWLW174]|uniref:acyltransferase family protein n=1 Tax=unclassified Bosea (in: a-proteobacteria) TaxID=2653178 RepID=UPI0030144163
MTSSSTGRADSKNEALEGLRGIASLGVFCAHFLFAFLPHLATYARPNLVIPSRYGWESIVVQPIFSVFYNGSFAVSIFFVLSGYVLTRRFMTRDDVDSLRTGAAKRYLRLTIPVLASTLFAWALFAAGLMKNGLIAELGSAGWPLIYYPQTLNFQAALAEALFGTQFLHLAQFNGPLWTIKIELMGSFVLFATYLFFGKKYFALNIAIYIAIVTCIAPQSEYLFHYLAIFLGSAIHYVERGLKRSELMSVTLVLAGLFLGSFDFSPFFSPLANVTLPTPPAPLPSFEVSKRVFYHTFGAVFIVMGVIGSASVARLLASRIPVYLGRLSFAMYLLHWPIIFSLSYGMMGLLVLRWRWDYGSALSVTALFTAVVVLAFSHLFERLVDRPAVVVSGWFAERVLRLGKTVPSPPVQPAAKP